MLKIVIFCLFGIAANVSLTAAECEYQLLEVSVTGVTSSSRLRPLDGYYTPVTEVKWTVDNPKNLVLDGFAVKITPFEGSRDLFPSDQCDSGENHVWVTTTNMSHCQRVDSRPCSTDFTESNFCLCRRGSCDLQASSTDCNDFWSAGSPHFQYTVLPTVRSLVIPIQMDVSYNISIMPYYRANLSLPESSTTLPKVDGCDENIFGEIRDEMRSSSCVNISIKAQEEAPEYFQVEVRDDASDFVAVSNWSHPYDGMICGLDHCKEYTVQVYLVTGGTRKAVIEPFKHFTSSPFEDGSRVPVLTPTTTPVPTTTEDPPATTTTGAPTTTTEKPIYYCEKTKRGDFTFPRQVAGFVSYSEETCDDGSTPLASIFCSSQGEFDLSRLVNATCGVKIVDITSQNFTETTLEMLQISTANVSTLTDDNVTIVADYLTNVSNFQADFSEKQVGEATEISSHLAGYYRQTEDSDDDEKYATQKQNLVRSLSQIARRVKFDDNVTSNVTTFSNDVNVEIVEVPRSRNNSDYKFDATFYVDEDAESKPFIPISIHIPSSALDDVVENYLSLNERIRIVSVGFRSSSLFPSQQTANWVISSNLGDSVTALERINLTNDLVTITDNDVDKPGESKLDDFKNVYTQLECVFWDFELEDWSSEGCFLQSPTSTICQCNHLTNFAVLVSRSIIPADFALQVVTYVGCGLSIIGLVLTFVVICFSRKLRIRPQMRILSNICLTLSVGMALFIFGVDSKVDTLNCTVLTVFMHYFFLVAWFWTAVYSFTLYRDIAQVLKARGKPVKVRIAAVVAYGVPLVIVLLNSGIALGSLDHEDFLDDPLVESTYRARNFCWLHQHSLYFGFLLSIGLVLLFNIVVFYRIIPRVTRGKSRIASTRASSGMGANVARVVTLVTTMGLSWLFGFLMLVSDNRDWLLAMSWLFTIVNAFQGVFIFYFTVIRSGELNRLCDPISKRLTSASTVSTGIPASDTRTNDI